MRCPFGISIRLSSDRTKLKITKITTDHANHLVSAKCYKHYPKIRKLDDVDKEYAKNQLDLNSNKKKLQFKIMQKTGKVVTLRDLTNIAQLNRQDKTRNDIDATIEILRSQYLATVDVCSDADNNFVGLLLQDQDMRNVFAVYPEILFFDATYKLTELIPVYVLAVEDSDGSTEVVGVCVLAVETKESLQWLLESFKKRNPAWEKVRVVMADKDMNERETIKTCLPNASLLIFSTPFARLGES